MADTKPEGAPSGGADRKQNRRFPRSRKRVRRGPGSREQEGPEEKHSSGSVAAPSQNEEQRLRRRRRRRARKDGPQESQVEPIGDITDLDYVPPSSVFIYTHIVRSGARDAAYEFRSERFGATSIGRRLEDYRLDLSVLFPEDKPTAEGEPKAATPAVAAVVVDDRFSDYDDYDDGYDDDHDDHEDEDENEDEPATPQDGV